MKLLCSFLAIGVACLAAESQAAVVAGWNFNTLTTATNNGTTYSASSGAGTLTVGVTASDQAGGNRGINSFAGTAVNAIAGDANGQALTIQGGALETTTPVENNGATVTIEVNLTSFEDIILSFATQRTSTGFNLNQLAWSTDGTTFTDFGTAYNPATSFAVQSFDLSAISEIENQATVFFRLTLTGATSNAGNNRIDNIQINAVPEPAAALLGSIGLIALLRRRRG
ncbi:PEP-CTERM sorting domain-containing protein [Luteolibacter sp. GHJ8]|uniref:PEP-CTERM sorting domain-containing protein n=1 Tax=Luteolibacter rhizosphaerae TaxID=2989719 RepID=A0ABT3G7G7_9BACT|nr:PEP-CTERM sorting domain-containing protein [Luteolibacter rhizosphaerae]MCW1915750.1 PEP-CTERM sorting domain-containing protein [Luteolibacter rhizosphaerae]